MTSTALFLSHTHRHGEFVVGSHHLSREMARLGWRVAHVSTPYSLAHRLGRSASAGRADLAQSGPRLAKDGVLDFVPQTLLPAQFSSARHLAKRLERLGFGSPDLVLVDQPKLAHAARALSGRPIVVYRPTDIYVQQGDRRLQQMAIGAADAVVATSAPILSDLGPLGVPSRVISNGVEFDRFAAGDESERTGAVYVGALDERFQWADVSRLARAHPHVPFRLFGPVPREAPEVPANVELRGAIPYSQVPAQLRKARVGLLPFSERLENAGRSPMKLYEYLAAGLHVAATDTPVMRSLDGIVETYRSPDEAIEVFTRLLTLPVNVEGRSAAEAQDWSRKAAALVEFASRIDR